MIKKQKSTNLIHNAIYFLPIFCFLTQSLGLVNNCYEDQKTMMTEVQKIAEQIASKSPLAIRGVKEMLLYSRDHSVASGLNHVATWNSAMLLSSDLEESIMALMQKRPPEYND